MPRLIHLNGPPAVGKSTLARRWADDHPGTLLCDIDTLRTMIGGWETYAESPGLSRIDGLALITAHLRTGHDVVVPQHVGRPDQLERFRGAAEDAGASYVCVLLVATAEEVARRFGERDAAAAPDDRWAAYVRAFWAGGGADELGSAIDGLERMADDAWIRVESTTPDRTYAALVSALDPGRDLPSGVENPVRRTTYGTTHAVPARGRPMRYMLFIKMAQDHPMPPPPALMGAMELYMKESFASGLLIDTGGLYPEAESLQLQVRQGQGHGHRRPVLRGQGGRRRLRHLHRRDRG